MTHPMLTKAARAVGDCIRQERPLGVPATNTDLARAVLQAIRGPDEGMIEAGAEAMSKSLRFRDGWAASIDHILNTKD